MAGSYIGQQLDEQDRELAAQQTTDVLTERVAPPAPGHSVYIAPRHRRTYHWSSDHTTTSGSSTLEQVSTTPQGNECRLVRELAVIKGKEVVQHTSYLSDGLRQLEGRGGMRRLVLIVVTLAAFAGHHAWAGSSSRARDDAAIPLDEQTNYQSCSQADAPLFADFKQPGDKAWDTYMHYTVTRDGNYNDILMWGSIE